MPAFLLAALAAASVVSSRFVADEARAQQARFLGSEPRWIDRAARGPTAYLYDGEPQWNGVWQTIFWNRRIDRVYYLPGPEVVGPVPQHGVRVEPDGSLLAPDDRKRPVRYVVASTWLTLAGRPVAQVTQSGLTQAGLVLWEIEPPLRLSTRTLGLEPNGDIYGPGNGRLAVYGCTRGAFQLTLLIKEPETVDLFLNGRRYRRLRFDAPVPGEVWRGTVPATAPRPGRICTLDVVPSGLLGTTVFTFQR